MKVVVLHKLTKEWLTKFEKINDEFSEHEIITFNKANPYEHIEDADIIVGGHIKDEELERAKNLKAIFVPWAGVNGLPWEKIRKKNITVSNNHGNSRFVAERAVSMLLALLGKIVQYHNDLAKGIWHGFSAGAPESDMWDTLQDKTCGIIGYGSIGKNIARFIKCFGCSIIAHKKRSSNKNDNLVDRFSFDLYETLESSDIVFISLPLTKETIGLIGKKEFEYLHGKYLVNISRGKIVEEEALYQSLKNNQLKGAALDVWYSYPEKRDKPALPSKYPVHTLPNVVLSPHVGGFTPTSLQRMSQESYEQLKEFLKNGTIIEKVDPDLMY
ncbi:MAG: 2-hydroxyacid dehydrogenase [Kosmotogaceae bacterium]